ncbi:hypothetical protein ACXJY6_18770 [Vibrio sp. RC27]
MMNFALAIFIVCVLTYLVRRLVLGVKNTEERNTVEGNIESTDEATESSSEGKGYVNGVYYLDLPCICRRPRKR